MQDKSTALEHFDTYSLSVAQSANHQYIYHTTEVAHTFPPSYDMTTITTRYHS